jgi:WD40 repeat protein/energy-coupling factor transporter ATP-binding protein EcfA2
LVRALVAGVGDFPEPDGGEEAWAAGEPGFAPLASVGPAVRDLASALARHQVDTGGDALVECDRATFLNRWENLLDSDEAGERPLIVHFAGHGTEAAGSLFLATSGADAARKRLAATCVSFGQLLEAAELSGRPVLFLLDVCQAGQALVQQQLADLAASRRQDALRNVWIIAACAADKAAYGAAFTAVTAEVLQRIADGELDIDPAMQYVPVETLAAAVDRHLAHADRTAGHQRRALVRTAHTTAAPEQQPFLLNPAHATGSEAGPLIGIDPRLREFALTCSPGLDPLHFATRAAGNQDPSLLLFTGRHSQLQRIQDWIDAPDNNHSSLLAVTGSPGSGKSALLGVAACLLHPELEPVFGRHIGNAVDHFEPTQSRTVLAVHARQLTLRQITEALHHQLARQRPDLMMLHDGPGASEGGHEAQTDTSELLLKTLRVAGDVLIILDALDEATNPAEVTAKLLLPLAHSGPGRGRPSPRVVVGTRPWWDTFAALHEHLATHDGSRLDLDPSTDADRDLLAADLESYLRKLLPRRHPARERASLIARRLAWYADHGAFLVAAFYAQYLLSNPGPVSAQPPCSITEVFDLHVETLARDDPWIRPVLEVMGQARGSGMPLDLLHAAALAHQPPGLGAPTPTPTDTRRALRKAAFYLRTTPDADHCLLYRYFHQALTDHTTPLTDPITLHNALIGTIPTLETGTPDWDRAHPYLLRHAADHAHRAKNGALDQLLTDPQWMVLADSGALFDYRDEIISDQAKLHADILWRATGSDSSSSDPAARRALLALEAVVRRQPALARAIETVMNDRPWLYSPRWATHYDDMSRRPSASSHTARVFDVQVTTGPGGTPLPITMGHDQRVIVWDVESGLPRRILEGHNRWLRKAALTADADGTPLAITAGDDRLVVWDLKVGAVRHTLDCDTHWVRELVVNTGADDTPLAITTADNFRHVMVWDVEAGIARHILEGHTGPVQALAVTTCADGTPLAITTGDDGLVIVWDVEAGTSRHLLKGHTRWVRGVVVTAAADGTPLAITGSHDGNAIVWDLESGQPRHILEGHSDWVLAVHVTAGADGTSLAVTIGDDDLMNVWDVETGALRHSFEVHAVRLRTVAVTTGADGPPLVVITGDNHQVKVCDVEAGTARTLEGHTNTVRDVVVTTGPHGAPLAITVSDDGTVRAWAVDNGEEQFRYHLPDGAQCVASTDKGFVIGYGANVAYFEPLAVEVNSSLDS